MSAGTMVAFLLILSSRLASACAAYPLPYHLGTERDSYSLIFVGEIIEVEGPLEETEDYLVDVNVSSDIRGKAGPKQSLKLGACGAKPERSDIGIFFYTQGSNIGIWVPKKHTRDYDEWIGKAKGEEPIKKVDM